MASLSMSDVSRFAKNISSLVKIVFENFLDKVGYHAKVKSSTLLFKAIVYYTEFQIMQKQCHWKEGDATFTKTPRLFKTNHGKTFNNWAKDAQLEWTKWSKFGRRLE